MKARPATYPAAVRFAQLVLLLAAHPEGVEVTALDAELGISPRTRMRYLAQLLDAFPEEVIERDGALVRLGVTWREHYAC